MHQCDTASPEENAKGFEFRVFPFPRPVALTRLLIPVYSTILPIARMVRRDDWMVGWLGFVKNLPLSCI